MPGLDPGIQKQALAVSIEESVSIDGSPGPSPAMTTKINWTPRLRRATG